MNLGELIESLGFEESRPRVGQSRVCGWHKVNVEPFEEELPLN